MPHYDDEARRAARERLEARMARRESPDSPSARTPLPQRSHESALRSRAASQRNAPRWLLAAAALAVLLLAAVIALALPRCAPEPQRDQPQPVEATDDSQLDGSESGGTLPDNQVEEIDDASADLDLIASIIGSEEAGKLAKRIETDRDARWVAAHLDAIAFEGPEVEAKLLKLLADDEAATAYVREFADRYPADGPQADASLAMSTESPSADVPSTSIPHLYQWDRRWAYTTYSSTSFGLTGCGPTSLAMIYQGLTGDAQMTPYDMGVLAQNGGFMAQYDGTATAFFTAACPTLGLSGWPVNVDAGSITATLGSGCPMIANLGPGYFTQYGHFFVLAGLDEDGRVIVNDPYSVVRSSQTWDANFIASESIALFAYSL